MLPSQALHLHWRDSVSRSNFSKRTRSRWPVNVERHARCTCRNSRTSTTSSTPLSKTVRCIMSVLTLWCHWPSPSSFLMQSWRDLRKWFGLWVTIGACHCVISLKPSRVIHSRGQLQELRCPVIGCAPSATTNGKWLRSWDKETGRTPPSSRPWGAPLPSVQYKPHESHWIS